MAALATLLLGTSQDSSSLPVIALTVAATSLLFTDFLGWFQLNKYLTSIAGVVAVVNAFAKSQAGGVETQFISVANLLIHLQIILLFQKKTLRIYWQLIVLSLLQVVVAAALNLFFLFGPLLVAYAVLALAALLLLFILRETRPYVASSGADGLTARGQDHVVIELGGAGEKSQVRTGGSSEANPRRDLVRRSLLRHLSQISTSTAIVAAAVFLLMPRFGNGVWRAKSGQQQTGYSGEVDLDDSSSILENPSVVMRVSFVDEWTGEPYTVSEEPYFRGGVLNQYSVRYGRWKSGFSTGLNDLKRPQRLLGVVKQNVTMEKQRGGTVFAVSPSCRLDGTPNTMKLNLATHEIVHEPGDDEDPAQYTIGTTAFRNGLQSEFVPRLLRVRRDTRDRDQVVTYLKPVAELANQIVAKAAPDASVLSKARLLQAHFATSGLYKYSLDPSPDRNVDVDPVEDFVTNHRTGHCQHFASALTLMLRSQGIPARIVVGYRGGTYNAVGNYYQIRELDAHAWVEALLPAEEVPDDEILPTDGLTGDAWVRLDPTPDSGDLTNIVAASGWKARLNDAIDYMQLLWSEYVLGLNQKRQRKAIYEPLKNAFRRFSDYCFSREHWAARWQALRDRFRGRLFTRQTLVEAGVAIVVLTAGFYAIRLLLRPLRRFWRRFWIKRETSRRPRVEFYRRFESLLARRGMRRRPNQTPREFAIAAADDLRASAAEPSVASIPAKIVELFYRVRFGLDHLDANDSQRLESLLQQLQQGLAGERKA